MSQTYMTAKLNLTDGTIVYPQVSLDNVVNSINDPTLATIATGISISVNGGTATLVTNGGSGVAKFVGANGLVVSMNEGNEVVFTAPTVSAVDSAAYADNAGSATHATSAGIADTLVSGYVVTSATNATSAGTAAAIASGAIVGGYKTEIVSGNTVGQMKWFNIVNTAGATVTVEPGEAYKINAANSAVTISATLGTVGQWGQEGHAEIFVAGTGNVHTGANVTLADGLEPDSVNNCTLRFHDGKCIISVEDHVAGYIVVSATGTSTGTLYYGLSTASEEYVAFDASLNGTTIPLAGAVAEGEKHVVGNGYAETAITGAVDCGTSKFTVANLGLNNVQVTGGTMTLGDVKIPSGSTVAVSGGGLAVEKVTGAGAESVIDLGGTNVYVSSGVTAIASGCTFSSGSASEGGCFYLPGGAALNLTSVALIKNSASIGAAVYATGSSTKAIMSDCVVSGNIPSSRAIFLYRSANLTLTGSNTLTDVISGASSGSVTLTSGAILDLTGNTNATPIAPGGGITFASGGATVLVGSGTASSSYMMDNVTLPAGAKLTNTAVVDLNNATIVASNTWVIVSGCTIANGSSYNGCLNLGNNTVAVLDGVSLTNNSGTIGFMNVSKSEATFRNCIASGNSWNPQAGYPGGITLLSATVTCDNSEIHDGFCFHAINSTGGIQIVGSNTIGRISKAAAGFGSVTISSGASINLANSINPGGTGGITVLTGGCTVNGVAVAGGTYTSIVSSGGSAVVNQ